MEHFGAVFKLDLTEETRTQLQEDEASLASHWLYTLTTVATLFGILYHMVAAIHPMNALSLHPQKASQICRVYRPIAGCRSSVASHVVGGLHCHRLTRFIKVIAARQCDY